MAWLILKIVVAVAAVLLLYLFGAGMIRSFRGAAPRSQPAEPGELQLVDIRFRCIVCGTLVTMTAAPEGEVPDAPRHCREDMVLVAEIM